MELRPTDEQEFLAALGRRVRHVRALRGMSRKVLAQVSGISERYIAQLESGKGNVSIKLLRRAAAAMGPPPVMAGLVPAIHAFPARSPRRGCPRQARA